MVTTIGVYVSKGGTGKSTLAALLAVDLAERGQRVALVDLDRQGTQCDIFDLYDEQGRVETLHQVLKRRVAAPAALRPVAGEWRGDLFVLPGGALTPLAVEEIKLNPARFGILNTLDIVRGPVQDLGALVEYVVLDMGPSDQVLSIAGLLAMDYLLIPIEPNRSSIERLDYVLQEVESVRSVHDVRIAGIVQNKVHLYFGGLRASQSVRMARDVLDQQYADLLLVDAKGNRVEIPFDQDWEVVRWSGEYQLTRATYIKDPVKQAARRFLNAVWHAIGGDE
ncbi:MAG: ParA family protein [Anaerolineae bacterium]